jgi:hypothetical protein
VEDGQQHSSTAAERQSGRAAEQHHKASEDGNSVYEGVYVTKSVKHGQKKAK